MWWDMRRNLDPTCMPPRRAVILCSFDPMQQWLGLSPFAQEKELVA
jgi:hypothetical protein